jgi:hypothetical protein
MAAVTIAGKPTNRQFLERFLLLPALLAGKLDANLALLRLNAVRRTAFAADRLDAGIALLDDEVFLFHRLADQPLGLFAHRLLRHPPLSANEHLGAVYSTPATVCE